MSTWHSLSLLSLCKRQLWSLFLPSVHSFCSAVTYNCMVNCEHLSSHELQFPQRSCACAQGPQNPATSLCFLSVPEHNPEHSISIPMVSRLFFMSDAQPGLNSSSWLDSSVAQACHYRAVVHNAAWSGPNTILQNSDEVPARMAWPRLRVQLLHDQTILRNENFCCINEEQLVVVGNIVWRTRTGNHFCLV